MNAYPDASNTARSAYRSHLSKGEIEGSDSKKLVRFMDSPDQYQQWKELTAAGISTPLLQLSPCLDINPDDFELAMPKDAWQVSDRLHLFKKDVSKYSQLFFMIGQSIRQIETTLGYGLATDSNGSILSSFLAYYDEPSEQGIEILLAPPYTLDTSISFEEMFEMISQELIHSDQFTSDEITVLLEAIAIGVECYDEEQSK